MKNFLRFNFWFPKTGEAKSHRTI